MSIIDSFIGLIINGYKYILVVIVLAFAIRGIISYRRSITTEYKCPNCQTADAERVSRNILTKLIHLNKNMKKFKCLKCWKIYYVKDQNITT